MIETCKEEGCAVSTQETAARREWEMEHFALCKEQQHSQKTGFFCDYGVAEAPPGFQAGWSDCMYFFLSFCS
jgi:hypothetical protein